MNPKYKSLSPAVIAVLTHQVIISGNAVTMPQLDRQLYQSVNAALTLLGGKWSKSAQAHLFPSDPTAIITAAFTEGEVLDEKKSFQFFPTPPPLARKMVRLLGHIDPTHTILEPSAGEGALVDALLEDGVAERQISLCELNPRCVDILSRKGYTNFIGTDFLKIGQSWPALAFDKIIANPPFCNNQDVDHVQAMFEQLHPGGTAVVLMSPSWQHGSQRKQVEFREWVSGEGFYTEEIPSGTFADTEIRTVLLVLTKAGSAEGRPLVSDSDRVIADVCNGRTIWNSDGTDGDCLVCAPPAQPDYQAQCAILNTPGLPDHEYGAALASLTNADGALFVPHMNNNLRLALGRAVTSQFQALGHAGWVPGATVTALGQPWNLLRFDLDQRSQHAMPITAELVDAGGTHKCIPAVPEPVPEATPVKRAASPPPAGWTSEEFFALSHPEQMGIRFGYGKHAYLPGEPRVPARQCDIHDLFAGKTYAEIRDTLASLIGPTVAPAVAEANRRRLRRAAGVPITATTLFSKVCSRVEEWAHRLLEAGDWLDDFTGRIREACEQAGLVWEQPDTNSEADKVRLDSPLGVQLEAIIDAEEHIALNAMEKAVLKILPNTTGREILNDRRSKISQAAAGGAGGPAPTQLLGQYESYFEEKNLRELPITTQVAIAKSLGLDPNTIGSFVTNIHRTATQRFNEKRGILPPAALPPATITRLPLPVPTQPKPALQRRRCYDLISQL